MHVLASDGVVVIIFSNTSGINRVGLCLPRESA